MLHKPESALIIIGHGSTVNPDSSAPTLDHAEVILGKGCFREVHCAFWKEEPSLRQVLHMVDSEDVYIVPNFISEGYFTRTILPRELELEGSLTHLRGRTLYYASAIGTEPLFSELLLDQVALFDQRAAVRE